jgi:hypothetical protein
MESERVYVLSSIIQTYLTEVTKQIDGLPASFIWNMDEMRHFYWINALSDMIFVSADHLQLVVPKSIHRQIKRTILTAAISPDGSYRGVRKFMHMLFSV